MALKKTVYLCINYNEYTILDVRKEIIEQADINNWIVGNSIAKVNLCDEFWCYGDCSELEAYKKAKELGKDIWQMM